MSQIILTEDNRSTRRISYKWKLVSWRCLCSCPQRRNSRKSRHASQTTQRSRLASSNCLRSSSRSSPREGRRGRFIADVLAPTRGRSLHCPTPTSSPSTTIGGRVHYPDVLTTKDAILGLWRDLGDPSENRCLTNLNVLRQKGLRLPFWPRTACENQRCQSPVDLCGNSMYF